MNPSNTAPSLISEINECHIGKVDKFFRMCAGASSRLTKLGGSTFHLKITIDRRVTEESVKQLIWNIAKSWRSQNLELSH